MNLTESVNNFDTKLNKITADICKEVEKITGSPLPAEQKKLSNLVPLLKEMYLTIVELKQSKKELEKTISKFQNKGNDLCSLITVQTGHNFPLIVKPDDFGYLHTYVQTGYYMTDWAERNIETVWSKAIYPNLQNGGKWRTKLNGKYVMKCSISFPSGEQRTMLEAAERPVDRERDFDYVGLKEIMLVE